MKKQDENTPNIMFGSTPTSSTPVNTFRFGSSKSKYDFNLNTNLEEQRAANQGFWDSAGNIALRLVGRTGMSALETGAMLGYGLPKAIVTGNLNSVFDNELTDGFKRLDKVLIDNSPFYQSEAERKASLFSKEYLTSTNFWGNLIGEGGGFVAGAMLGGGMIGKTMGAANRIAKSAGIIASDGEKIAEVANAVKSPGNILDKFLNLAKSTSAKNASQYYTQKIGGNMYEAGVEARGIKDEIIRAKEEKFKKENPDTVVPEYLRAQWESMASTYANVGFGLNMALLMIDGFNMSKFLKGYTSTNRTVNALEKGGQYLEKGKYGRFADATKAFLGGPLSEAAQEGGQFLTEKTLSDIASKDTKDSKQTFTDYFMSTMKGLEETFGSKEGQESMLAGFLLGAPFNIKQGIETGQLDREGITALQKFSGSGTIKNQLKYNMEAYDKNVGGEKDEAALNNSKFLHENIKRNEWFSYVKNRDDAGRFDDVLDDIYREKIMPLDAFKQVHGEHFTEEKRQLQLNELEKQAKYFKKVSDEVNNSFTSHPNKDALIQTSVNINNYTQRINELQGKLTDNALPTIIKSQIVNDLESLREAKTQEETKLADYLTLKTLQPSEAINKDNNTTIEKVTIDGQEGVIERRNEATEENPEPTLVISTSAGQIIVPEKDLDNNLSDQENNFEESEYNDFGEDITPDVAKSEGKGAKWMVLNPNDPEANWLNFGDVGLKDYREQAENISEKNKGSELHKSLIINADKADVIKDDIIDNNTAYDFIYKKQVVSGKTQYNIFAKKGNTETKIGYILNFDTAKAAMSDMSINEYLDTYMKGTTPNVEQKKGVISRIRSADQKLKSSNTENVNNAVSLSTRIKGSAIPSILTKVLNSPFKNRWMVNGELVIVKYQKGNYVPITKLSDDNKKLLLEQLQKPSNAAFLGSQYAVLVKRPSKDPNQYSFIGFRGTEISKSEKNSFIKKMKDPNVDKETLVKEMNERMFITSNKTFSVYDSNGQKVADTHLFFDTDFKGNVVIRREPKLISGVKNPIPLARRQSKAITDPDKIASYINMHGYERISGENANNIDYVSDRVQTLADPSIWRSFFKFSHNIYGDKPKSVDNSFPSNTPSQDEELEKPAQVYTKDGVTAKIYSKYSVEEKDNKGTKFNLGSVNFTATRSDKPDTILQGDKVGYVYDDERGNYLNNFVADYDKLIEDVVDEINTTSNKINENKVTEIRVIREFGYFSTAENKNVQYIDVIVTDGDGKSIQGTVLIDKRKFLPATIVLPNTTKFSPDVQKKIDEIKKNASFIVLDKSKKFYVNTKTGQQLKRVTDFISDEEESSDWFESASTIGTKSDFLVRDFFDNNLRPLSNYDVAPDKEINTFLSQLDTLRKSFKKNNETVIANDIVLYDEKLGVAGTVDLLTVDSNGNFRIYDMKTMRGDNFMTQVVPYTTTGKQLNPVSKYEFKGYYDKDKAQYVRDLGKDSKLEKHQKQLSMYRLLLNNTHGILAKRIAVIPIEVDYNKGDRSTKKLNLLSLKDLAPIDNIKDAVLSTQNASSKYLLYQDLKPGQKLNVVAKENGEKGILTIKSIESPTFIRFDINFPNIKESDIGYQEREFNEFFSLESISQELPVNPLQGTAPSSDFFSSLSSDPDAQENPSGGFKPGDVDDYLVDTYFEEVNKEIKQIINVEVKLEDMRDSMGRPLNYGRFENAVVYLASKAPKGTLWHEGFHAVFSVLPENEKSRVLKIAFDKLGVTDLDVQNLRKVYQERGYSDLTEKFLVEKVLEEKIADLFQDHMNGRPTTILERFFKMLENLINYLFGKTNDPVFKAFFKEIEGGKYRHVSPEGEVVSFKTIPYATSIESDKLMNLLTAQYLNRKSTDPDALYEFIQSRLDDIRRGYNVKIRNEYADKLANIEQQKANTLLSQEDYNAEIGRLQAEINSKYINKDGLVYPKFLAEKYEKNIINQTIQYADFKKVYEEGDEEDQDERTKSFSESEFDKAVHATPAGQAVKAKFKTIMIDDPYFREVPINTYGIFNNLLFNLNGVSKDNIEAKLESLISDSTFGRSINAILEEYRTDDAFKAQMQTAFDRIYANAYKVVSTNETNQNQNFAKLENGDDHIKQQMEDWKGENLANRKPTVKIVDSNSLLENLGITITEDAMKNEEVTTALNDLADYMMFNLSGSINPFSDERAKALMEKIANINIQSRDDLGELNFKNAEGKPQSSIINSSYIFRQLDEVNNKYLGKMRGKWGIYVGSKFGSKTTDYNHIDPKTYFISNLALYRDANGPMFVLQQPSDKSTIPLVRGKKFSIEEVPAIMLEEKARQDTLIQKNYQDILDALAKGESALKNLIKGYHYTAVKGESIKTSVQKAKKAYEEVLSGKITRADKSVPRGYKYYNLPNANEVKGQYTLRIAEEYLGKMLENDLRLTKKLMSTYGLSENDVKRLGVKNTKTFFEEFLLNQYVNRMILLSEISPDLGQFKDFTDITKRGAGLMASGPNYYSPGKNNEFKFAIIPDRKKAFTSSVKVDDDAETLDAQGFELAEERLNRLERHGRVSKNSSLKNDVYDQLYQDYITIQAFINDDRELIKELENKNAPLNVDKTVGYGKDYYIKTSVKVLTRYFSSDVSSQGATRVINKVKYTAQQDINNGKWYLPIHGREFEWNLINEMQQKGISAAFAESAVKKGIRNVADYNEGDNPGTLSLIGNSMSYMDYRLQQENKSSKEKVVDGSQSIQLIDSNLPLDTILPDGRTVKKVREENDKLISKIKDYQKNVYLNGMDNFKVGDKKYSAFVNYITSSLSTSGSTDRILEFFEGDGEGGFRFSSSLPMIEEKFEELLMAYFNNNIAKHKVPGDKFTLSSSEFYKKITDKNGNVLTTYEYNKLNEKEKSKLIVSDLSAPNQNSTYAEVVLSEQYLDQLGITIEDWVRMKEADPESKEGEIFKKISTFMGYRIPTQAHHSMLPCKIIDFMPREFGSTIVLPAEVTKLSGADYDVDSLFVHRYSVYKDSEGNLQLEDDSIEAINNSALKNPLVKELLKVYKEEEKRAIRKEINKAYRRIGELKEERAAGKNIGGQLRIAKDTIFKLEQKETSIDKESLSEIKKFLNITNDINPNKVFNDLLDNRMQVLTSQEGRFMINYPAEDHFKGLHEKVFSQHPNFTEQDEYSTYANYSTFFNEFAKVFSGGKAIGGAANINKVFAFLIKNGAILRKDNTRIYEFFNHEFNIHEINEVDRNIVFENGEFKFTNEVVRPKSDTLSNNVSITVDNAKDQTLVKFNLTDKNIAEASVLAGLGFGRNRTGAFFLNPMVKLISDKLIISDSILNDSYQTKEQQIDSLLGKYADTVPVRTVTDDDLLKCLSLDYDKVYSLLTLNKKYEELTEDEQEIVAIQVNLGRMYKEVVAITSDCFTVNTVINYNKEVGRYLYEMDKILGSVAKIQKSESFTISGIQENEIVSNIYDNILSMKPEGQKRLLSYNENASIFLSDVIDGTKKDGFTSSDQEFQSKMRKDFVRYLAMKVLGYYEGNNVINPKAFPIKDPRVITGERVVAAFEKAKPLLSKSPLGSQLQIINPSPRYPFPRVGAESFSNIDGELKQLLINSFDDFLKDSNKDIQQLGLELLYHIAAHDNFKYVSNSVIGHISPEYFSLLNRIYKGVPEVQGLEKLFNQSQSYAEFKQSLYDLLRGQTENEKSLSVNGFINELKKDFVKHFFIDSRNSMHVSTIDSLNKKNKFYGVVNNEKVPGKLTWFQDPRDKTKGVYTVSLPGSPRFPFVVKTSVRLPNDDVISNTYSVSKIYTIKNPNPAEPSLTQIEYEMHTKPNKKVEFNTRFYQLPFNANIELFNAAIALNASIATSNKEDQYNERQNYIPPRYDGDHDQHGQDPNPVTTQNSNMENKIPSDNRIPEYWIEKDLFEKKNQLARTTPDVNDPNKKNIVVAKGITPDIFYNYLTGNDNLPTSLQKKEVLKYMEADGWSLSRIQSLLNSQKKIYEFLILHEYDHIVNNDSAVYWKNGRDLMTLDKIEIEARASVNALEKILSFTQPVVSAEEKFPEVKPVVIPTSPVPVTTNPVDTDNNKSRKIDLGLMQPDNPATWDANVADSRDKKVPPSMKPIPATNAAITKISINFETYKPLLASFNILSVEDLINLPPDEKNSLVQRICNS